jgi:hypothetical protein
MIIHAGLRDKLLVGGSTILDNLAVPITLVCFWNSCMTDASVELKEALGSTSSNLLLLIKAKDQEGWRRFVHLYGPLVYGWCRRFGLQEADAADVGQDVFRKAIQSIDGFHHDRN